MMNLTQSAISHGIKRLESQLGCALIYKKGKTAHLTPEGRHSWAKSCGLGRP